MLELISVRFCINFTIHHDETHALLSLSFSFKVYGKYVIFEVWFIRSSLVLISIMKLNIDQLKSVSCWIILINFFSVCVCMMINNLTRRQTHEWRWWYTGVYVLGWTQGYASKWEKMCCLYECFPNVCFYEYFVCLKSLLFCSP